MNVRCQVLLRATKRNPNDQWSFVLLGAAYGQLGRKEETKTAIDAFKEKWRNTQEEELPFTLANVGDWDFKDPVARECLREGLRKAGLPEGKAPP